MNILQNDENSGQQQLLEEAMLHLNPFDHRNIDRGLNRQRTHPALDVTSTPPFWSNPPNLHPRQIHRPPPSRRSHPAIPPPIPDRRSPVLHSFVCIVPPADLSLLIVIGSDVHPRVHPQRRGIFVATSFGLTARRVASPASARPRGTTRAP